MDPKAIVTDAILNRVSPRADGSLTIGFVTPELTPEQKLVFLQIHNRECKLLVTPKDAEKEAPIEVKSKMDTKSPSARQRDLLYVLWNALGAEGNFDSWYGLRMTKNCQRIRDEIDALKC